MALWDESPLSARKTRKGTSAHSLNLNEFEPENGIPDLIE